MSEKEKKTEETTDLVPATELSLSDLPDIDPEVIEAVVKAGDGDIMWLRNTTGGFEVSDGRTLNEVTGVICHLYPHFVQWADGEPDKIDDDGTLECPPDYERRVDVHLWMPGGYIFGLSIPQGSYRKNFSPYIKGLVNKGLRPNQVMTRFECKSKRNKEHTYPEIRPYFVGEMQDEDEGEGDVPF
jgi:hypothetical protein